MSFAEGYWISCVSPKLDDKVPLATWRTALSLPDHKSKAWGLEPSASMCPPRTSGRFLPNLRSVRWAHHPSKTRRDITKAGQYAKTKWGDIQILNIETRAGNPCSGIILHTRGARPRHGNVFVVNANPYRRKGCDPDSLSVVATRRPPYKK